MRPKVSMRAALTDRDLFGTIMQDESWRGWRILLIAAAGEELTDEERIEFKRLTGREREPGRRCHEFVAIFGRRAGKTLALSVFTIWLAALHDFRGTLVPGETGIALIISRDQRAAKTTLDYIAGILADSAILRQLIANRTADAIELTNGISIEVRPCNKISSRGITCISITAEEIGHWFTAVDFQNPDVEVLAAVRPTLMTTRGPLLMASSAYAKRGVLYDNFKKYYGADGPPDIIVAYGTSRDANPSLPQADIDRELERDAVRNRAEYLSEWRTDAEGFIPRAIVEACVGNYYELPPQPNLNYECFIDQATGVPEGDSFAITVAHKVDDRAVVDAVREIRPPFDFFEVVETVLVPLCKAYRIYKVWGDNYGALIAQEPIRRAGVGFELAKKHKSELYNDPFLPMLNAGKVILPRHERAINQICSLERSVQRSGRDQISHPTHGHDDIANAVAGAVDLVASGFGYDRGYRAFQSGFVDLDQRQPQAAAEQPDARYFGTWDWHKAMPKATTFAGDADENLRQIYRAIDRVRR